MIIMFKTKEEMGKKEKDKRPLSTFSHVPDMEDDIRLDDDLSLYGVIGIPNYKKS